MEPKNQPVFQTVTEEGTKIEINIPSAQELKQQITQQIPPSNEEITRGLEGAKQTLEEQKGDLSGRGQKIAEDTETLIDTALKTVQEKNQGEQFQKVFLHTKEALDKNAPLLQTQTQIGQLGVDTENLQVDTQKLYEYIKNFLWNFGRSEEFRDLLTDWIAFFQFIGTKTIKEQAQKQQMEGGAVENVAKAVEEGVEQTPQPPVSQEELEQRTEDKFFQLMDRIQNKEEYQRIFKESLLFLDQLRDKLYDLAKEAEVKSKLVDSEPFWKALFEAEELLVQFTGKEEWESFKNNFYSSYNRIREDQELNLWFSDLKSFMNEVAENPEKLKAEEYKNRIKGLLHLGREILQEQKWNQIFEDLSNQMRVLMERVKQDSTTQDFTNNLQQLAQDVAFNKEGYPDLFVIEDSIIQIKNFLIPVLREQLEKINISKINLSNDTYDMQIEDVGFSGSFLPEHIDLRIFSDSHLDIKDPSKDVSTNTLEFQVDKIKPEFRNFKFYYNRKVFPKIEDYGVASIKITGDGALMRVVWKIETKSGSYPLATLKEVKCHIDRLEISVLGEYTKHEFLDWLLAPLFAKSIKNRISSGIEDYLQKVLLPYNQGLNELLRTKMMEGMHEKANVALKEAYKQAPEPVKTKSVSSVESV